MSGILPKQTTRVSNYKFDSFAVAEFSHSLLLIQSGVSEHYYLWKK